MNELDYFEDVPKMVDQLHEASHTGKVPMGRRPNEVNELYGLFGSLCDCIQYLVNSSSWTLNSLTKHDKTLLRQELEDKVLWRLK